MRTATTVALRNLRADERADVKRHDHGQRVLAPRRSASGSDPIRVLFCTQQQNVNRAAREGAGSGAACAGDSRSLLRVATGHGLQGGCDGGERGAPTCWPDHF